MKTPKKSKLSSNSVNNKSVKYSSTTPKQHNQLNINQKQISIKSLCSHYSSTHLVNTAYNESSKRKSNIVECLSCGKNLIRSCVSDDEQRQHPIKVTNDHLKEVKCQFCKEIFHEHGDYLTHLRNDHGSTKPL